MGTIPRFSGPGQFDRYCKLVLEHEAIDYLRKMSSLRDRYISLNTLPQKEMDRLSAVDRYPSDSYIFSSHGCDLLIENELVADAFAGLTEQEASDWAYLAAEVINWEWLMQVLKAASWEGSPQEAIDIIRAAVIVEETIKVGIEAEAPRA